MLKILCAFVKNNSSFPHFIVWRVPSLCGGNAVFYYAGRKFFGQGLCAFKWKPDIRCISGGMCLFCCCQCDRIAIGTLKGSARNPHPQER